MWSGDLKSHVVSTELIVLDSVKHTNIIESHKCIFLINIFLQLKKYYTIKYKCRCFRVSYGQSCINETLITEI